MFGGNSSRTQITPFLSRYNVGRINVCAFSIDIVGRYPDDEECTQLNIDPDSPTWLPSGTRNVPIIDEMTAVNLGVQRNVRPRIDLSIVDEFC